MKEMLKKIFYSMWACPLNSLFLLGFIAPALISAPNTELVLLGIVYIVASLYWLAKFIIFYGKKYYNL